MGLFFMDGGGGTAVGCAETSEEVLCLLAWVLLSATASSGIGACFSEAFLLVEVCIGDCSGVFDGWFGEIVAGGCWSAEDFLLG